MMILRPCGSGYRHTFPIGLIRRYTVSVTIGNCQQKLSNSAQGTVRTLP